uniref:Uncharacterized protein n=1 Tax=Meloidogyne enterolobii TaxID=390850 RepID=A0A6V7XFZ1_MELEN|nr:unnamed protein product [Meloidogyne enterolobii]
MSKTTIKLFKLFIFFVLIIKIVNCGNCCGTPQVIEDNECDNDYDNNDDNNDDGDFEEEDEINLQEEPEESETEQDFPGIADWQRFLHLGADDSDAPSEASSSK